MAHLLMLPALALWLSLSGAPPPFTWDIPEVIEAVPVGTSPSSGGRPMQLRAVKSRWSADKLLKKLGEDFLRAGLWIPPPHEQPQNQPLKYVSAIDGWRMINYQVFFQVNRDGSTTLILAEVDLEARVAATPAAPVFPGAVGVVTSDVEAMRTVAFRAKASPAEVQAFYREVLGKGGYRDAGGGTYERGPERFTVIARGPDKDGMVRVVVMTTAGAPAAPAPAPAAVVREAPPPPSH